MSDNFDDNKTYDNTYIDSHEFSSYLNYLKYDSIDSSSYKELLKELLQELHIILEGAEYHDAKFNIEDELKDFVNNFLFEYDLDPNNVFEIMTSFPQNISYYSSLIGFFYQYGIGCYVDRIKAFEMFSNSFKNNQKTESDQINQISFYQENEGITFCNDNKKLNEIISQYFYSLFLYKDIILNRKDNYKLHVRNAEKGDSVSQYYLGNCYFRGKNDKQGCNLAIEWYTKSSEGGNIKAIYRLGKCYFYGYGITKDEKKAVELYLKSAKGGYKDALAMMGFCHFYGYGVIKDENKAFEWYLKAAKKGDSYSQERISNYYDNGLYVSKNEAKGFYWNRKAAINGKTSAQYKLAKYYLSDTINKNERKVFGWYLKLANKNIPKARYLVAKCYRDGIGTNKNLDEATEWFKKSESSSFGLSLNAFLNGSNINHLED